MVLAIFMMISVVSAACFRNREINFYISFAPWPTEHTICCRTRAKGWSYFCRFQSRKLIFPEEQFFCCYERWLCADNMYGKTMPRETSKIVGAWHFSPLFTELFFFLFWHTTNPSLSTSHLIVSTPFFSITIFLSFKLGDFNPTEIV